MCTIVIVNQVHPVWPVVIAANRDELFERPAGGPRRWPGAHGIVAPIDLSRGGTWMGVTESGFFVAVTNQRSAVPPAPDARSRGHLVMALLEAGSPSGAREHLAGVDARDFSPFNLLFGDASGLELGYGRRSSAEVEITRVPPGVHVLPNDVLDHPGIGKVARLRRDLPETELAGMSEDALVHRLYQALGDRQRPELEEVPDDDSSPWPREFRRELDAVAIETPRYGTRSSAILALVSGAWAGYWHSPGPPHRTPLVDVKVSID